MRTLADGHRCKDPNKTMPLSSITGRSRANADNDASLQAIQEDAGDGLHSRGTSLHSSMDQETSVNERSAQTPLTYFPDPLSLLPRKKKFGSSFDHKKSIAGSSTPSSRSAAALADPHKVFTLFPKLSLELRRMIWHQALSNTQVICVDCGDFLEQIWLESTPTDLEDLAGDQCVLTAVSKEARREALRVQKPLECWKKIIIGLNRSHKERKTIYWNPDLDIVWVADNWSDFFPKGIMQGITTSEPHFPRMAYSISLWYLSTRNASSIRGMASRLFKYSTREVFLVVGEYAAFGSRQTVFIEPRADPTELVEDHVLPFWAPDSTIPCTWEFLRERIVESFQFYKTELETRKKSAIAGTILPSPSHEYQSWAN